MNETARRSVEFTYRSYRISLLRGVAEEYSEKVSVVRVQRFSNCNVDSAQWRAASGLYRVYVANICTWLLTRRTAEAWERKRESEKSLNFFSSLCLPLTTGVLIKGATIAISRSDNSDAAQSTLCMRHWITHVQKRSREKKRRRRRRHSAANNDDDDDEKKWVSFSSENKQFRNVQSRQHRQAGNVEKETILTCILSFPLLSFVSRFHNRGAANDDRCDFEQGNFTLKYFVEATRAFLISVFRKKYI